LNPQRLNILLVDDSQDYFLIVEEMLYEVTDWQCELEWVNTFEQGLEAICRAAHDIYLLDYHLGNRKGTDLLREVVGQGCKGPFILLTADDNREVDLEVMKSGAADFLMKGEVTPRLLERSMRYARERAQALEALRESEQRYALVVEASNDGIWDWKLGPNSVYFSERWKEMLGFAAEEIGDQPSEWFERVHDEDLAQLYLELNGHLDGRLPFFETEFRMLHRDGTYHWMHCRGVALRDKAGKAFQMAGSLSDITRRKLLEEELQHDALHDHLTGLPNRTLFLDRLEQALEISLDRPDYAFAVLFLDLDGFKRINDTLGHLFGDQLLVTTARRLEGCLRANDTVARFGGDEFVILLNDYRDPSDPVVIAERILSHLSVPFNLSGNEVAISVSIGITVSRLGYERSEDVLRDADAAMYQAKQGGRSRYIPFAPIPLV
jgi:diguanylate cyclase (GGDEF)-like protein/PAS domain S-box-containing protein